MKTVSALLAGAISELLDSGETVDTAAARELMGAARWGGPLDRMVMHGPLKELAAVTSEAVDARLARLRSARWSVFVPDDSDAATTLVVLLNVLLADDAALRVEQYYAQAARSAMVAAIIADLRGDGPGIDAARDELSAAARGALVCLASGTEIDAAPVVSASALVRAELRSRLRGEIPTTARDAAVLRIAVLYLVDADPHGLLPLGRYDARLGCSVDALSSIREDVLRRLRELYHARAEVFRAWPWPATGADVAELLALLLLVVLSADAAASIARAYADVEAQAVAGTAIAHLRGDGAGVARQWEMLRAAGAEALRRSGDPRVPVDVKAVEALLRAELIGGPVGAAPRSGSTT
ncbi:hypothetical protein AN480_27715 (plasmid) [Mycobacterium intracellulare subsp. chimaera]|uniref:DUF2336 domain-containing protein n=1 Tax=Mycobacterium intracellulare subsp. chimaera TaxID=222805 RepID=A0ABT7P7P9_MYCIT|nr:hypothetical protein [Mycobacterium intracellulare]AOS94863.1 hypothetical protein AN480_27715 [Mycobacterium intracellulare subsp. chimaera]MDM3929290.1 hypothetical protein [Mycobacterium intracellulare subsp. chimaera]